MAVIIDTLPVIISVDSKCYDETSALLYRWNP
jgi:hypothetical protein